MFGKHDSAMMPLSGISDSSSYTSEDTNKFLSSQSTMAAPYNTHTCLQATLKPLLTIRSRRRRGFSPSKKPHAFFSSNLDSGVISGCLWELPGTALDGALLT